MSDLCIQEEHAPKNACFGCGPANAKGLRIRSFAASEEADAALTCEWIPEAHHEAFPGVINGGIIGALLDCHSNWAAVHHLMRRDSMDSAPCCVTAEFTVRMRHPTPSGKPIHLIASPVSSQGSWVDVEASLSVEGQVTATCSGKFVRVKPGHPAHHRW